MGVRFNVCGFATLNLILLQKQMVKMSLVRPQNNSYETITIILNDILLLLAVLYYKSNIMTL